MIAYLTCQSARVTLAAVMPQQHLLPYPDMVHFMHLPRQAGRAVREGSLCGARSAKPSAWGSQAGRQGQLTGCTGWLVRQRGAQTPLADSSRRSSAAAVSFLLASSSPKASDSGMEPAVARPGMPTMPVLIWGASAGPSSWLTEGVPMPEKPLLADDVSSSTCKHAAPLSSRHHAAQLGQAYKGLQDLEIVFSLGPWGVMSGLEVRDLRRWFPSKRVLCFAKCLICRDLCCPPISRDYQY